MSESTGFVEIHRRLGARMVDFAGFSMPVHYGSITEEHRAVRERAGLFDVSHMGEFVFSGPGAMEAVQRVTVNDVSALAVGQAHYSAMVDESGGILDDCVVYRNGDDAYMMVVNAANVAADGAHVRAHQPADAGFEDVSERTSLLALQGPEAAGIVAPLVDASLDDLGFYRATPVTLAGTEVLLSRTGYTGEDGFELYFDRADSVAVWEALVESGEAAGLRPAGLGARDTLRLEMKYALYGNDIDRSTNPYEAGLGWIVKLDAGDFVGREALARIRERGPERKLVGFRMTGREIPRPGYPVRLGGESVAEVRSGTMSPSLGYGIGTCYLPAGRAGPGTKLTIDVRGRAAGAEVVDTPFYTEGSLRR